MSVLARFLNSQSYGLDVIAQIVSPHSVKRQLKFSFDSYGVFDRISIWFRMTVENFVQNVSIVFDKIEKVHNWLFFVHVQLFLESQLYDIIVIAHIGPPYNVKWL